MTIYTYEKSGRGRVLSKMLSESRTLQRFSSATVLPIPTTKDGRTLNGTDIPLSAVLPLVSAQDLIIGYGIPEGLREDLEAKGAIVCDSLFDERFLEDNGYLTAVATVGIIITSSEKAVCDMSIGIVGYGRIGKSLTRILLSLGARVKVLTSRRGTCLELGESGISSAISTSEADIENLDLLINTAPAVIFDTSSEEKFPGKLRVIDLASGDNFPGLSNVERYPSVPAKMFPFSSGKIWFESVERMLPELKEERKGERR